jgi:hypothetical protein
MKKYITMASIALLAGTFAHSASARPNVNINKILHRNPGLKRRALLMGLNAYDYAVKHGDVKNKGILTIVDFTKRSNEKRMYVINLADSKVLIKSPVAHGKGSGRGPVPTHFSNAFHSHASSPGIYTTLNTYSGHHGFSLRLKGLESGINSHALARDIVVHEAWYMKPGFLRSQGRAGNSWGCFAVPPHLRNNIIDTIKGGTVLFAYANSENHDPLVDNLHTPVYASNDSKTEVADNQKVVSNSHNDA